MYLKLRSKIRSEAAEDSDHRMLVFLGHRGDREIVAAAPRAQQEIDFVPGDQSLVVADRAIGVAGVVVVDQLDREACDP